MKPQIINIEEFVHSGEGFNGESFNHRNNPDIMLKLYNASAGRASVERELFFARKFYDAGLPTPRPGDFVTDGAGRYGIRFERIVGKVSFSRAIGDNPEMVEYYARRFAGMCLKLHSTHVVDEQFPNVKDLILSQLAEDPYFDEREQARVREILRDTPDADILLHGDLQYSNAILVDDKEYFIDLGDAACGHPYFDLGQVMLCCHWTPPAFMRWTFHMEPETGFQFWKFFVREYFGEKEDLGAVGRLLRPYSALKTLIIERDAHMRKDLFHRLLW